jgi:hypothetical protein
MATRTYLLPGVGIITETGERTYLLSGAGIITETLPTASGQPFLGGAVAFSIARSIAKSITTKAA